MMMIQKNRKFLPVRIAASVPYVKQNKAVAVVAISKSISDVVRLAILYFELDDGR